MDQRRDALALPFVIQPDGTRDPAYNPTDATFDDRLVDVAVLPDGRAIFAGEFRRFGTDACAGYAGLTAAGTFDTEFKSDTGFHSLVPKDAVAVAYDPRGFAYLSSSGISSLFQPTFQTNPIPGNGPVRVFAPPAELAILRQSTGGRVELGGSVTLSVRAVGTSALSYQWFKNGSPLPEATGPELVLTDFSPADNGDYTAQVSNASGTVTSALMTLRVLGIPEITLQPEGAELEVGDTHTFSVEAIGADTLSYQWLHNGVEIPGATAASLELTGLQLDDAGEYQVRISNTLGTVHSRVTTLVVKEITGRLVAGFISPDLDNTVSRVALFPDGTALLGGPFTIGAFRQHDWFTRIGPDEGFIPGWSENPPGRHRGRRQRQRRHNPFHRTGRGGRFFNAAQGAPHPSLIRLNDDGTIDPTFALPEGPNNAITAVGELPGGRLLVGRRFTQWGARRHLFMGRLNADASWDETFTVEPNDYVTAIHTFPDRTALGGQKRCPTPPLCFPVRPKPPRLPPEATSRLNSTVPADAPASLHRWG